MTRRITIEINADLLARAGRALDTPTTRATVEEALRRVAEAETDEAANRAARQRSFLRDLAKHADVDVLASDQMGRQQPGRKQPHPRPPKYPP